MAKFKGELVVLSETNLPALFYYKYLCESHFKEVKASPVQYYDEINKKGIDEKFKSFIEPFGEGLTEDHLSWLLSFISETIEEVRKTTSHDFYYDVIQSGIPDEGLANKLKAVEAKKIKEHKEPYNDITKKYSVHVYNG